MKLSFGNASGYFGKLAYGGLHEGWGGLHFLPWLLLLLGFCAPLPCGLHQAARGPKVGRSRWPPLEKPGPVSELGGDFPNECVHTDLAALPGTSHYGRWRKPYRMDLDTAVFEKRVF